MPKEEWRSRSFVICSPLATERNSPSARSRRASAIDARARWTGRRLRLQSRSGARRGLHAADRPESLIRGRMRGQERRQVGDVMRARGDDGRCGQQGQPYRDRQDAPPGHGGVVSSPVIRIDEWSPSVSRTSTSVRLPRAPAIKMREILRASTGSFGVSRSSPVVHAAVELDLEMALERRRDPRRASRGCCRRTARFADSPADRAPGVCGRYRSKARRRRRSSSAGGAPACASRGDSARRTAARRSTPAADRGSIKLLLDEARAPVRLVDEQLHDAVEVVRVRRRAGDRRRARREGHCAAATARAATAMRLCISDLRGPRPRARSRRS